MKRIIFSILAVLLLFACGNCLAASVKAKVFTVNFASADSVAAIAKKLLSPAGKISSDPRTNRLVVVDYPANLANIEKLIAQMDVKPRTSPDGVIYFENR